MQARTRSIPRAGRGQPTSRPGPAGVTLLELCFALALVAVLSTLAAPGLRASQRTAAVRAAAYELLAALHQVRTQSILESRTGALCLSGRSGGCQSPPASGAAWQSYLEGTRGTENLGVGTLPRGVVVHVNRSPLRFWPHAHSASPATLTICDEQGVAGPRAIVVSQTGRARLTNAPAEACAA
jgi:Tfp pilus assembly protein FimT